jgi:hypothetical protein
LSVGESSAVAQSLAGVQDAGSAFSFLEWFAREWLMPLRGGDGCTADEVAAAEERLGLRLPASLAAFYRLLGRRGDLTSHQDRLVVLNSLTVEDGVLVYRIEAAGCASWGVRIADLGLADPPTVVYGDYESGGSWRPFLDSFSLAAVEMVLSEAVMPGHAEWYDCRKLDEADIVRLEQLYERLPFPEYPGWWRPEVESVIRWFGGPDVLLREDGRAWLWVLARSPASLARVRDALPGQWPEVTAPREAAGELPPW